MRGPEADRALERALVASAAAIGALLSIDAQQASRWDSVTFTGTRHAIEASASRGAPLEAWIARLPSADLRLRGHLLANLAVTETGRSADRVRMRIEALTVAEG